MQGSGASVTDGVKADGVRILCDANGEGVLGGGGVDRNTAPRVGYGGVGNIGKLRELDDTDISLVF